MLGHVVCDIHWECRHYHCGDALRKYFVFIFGGGARFMDRVHILIIRVLHGTAVRTTQ